MTTTMHPDAAAVYSRTWTPDAPVERSDGRVTVAVRAKTLSATATTDYHDADRIARRLVTGARLTNVWTGVNGNVSRIYTGRALTDLAVRRG